MRARMPLALILAAVGSGLLAQEGTSYGMVHLGRTKYDTKPFEGTGGSLEDATHYGLGVGHWYGDSWGIDLRGLHGAMDGADTLDGMSSKRLYMLGSVNFNLNPGGTVWPYLAAGLGGTMTGSGFSESGEKTTRLNAHAGLGLQGILSDHVLWGLDWKVVRTFNQVRVTDHLFTLGLGWRFGGGRKAAPLLPPPAPAPAAAPAPEPAKVEPPPPPAPPPPPPEPPKVVPTPPPPPSPPQKFVLDEASLHFGNGKAEVDDAGRAAIRTVADSLKAFPGRYTVTITGHTSAVGGKAFNRALSKKRAEAVARVLVDWGIPAGVISAEGAGPDRPLGDNSTKEGQAKNRRVEIDVKAEGANVEVRKTETDIKQ